LVIYVRQVSAFGQNSLDLGACGPPDQRHGCMVLSFHLCERFSSGSDSGPRRRPPCEITRSAAGDCAGGPLVRRLDRGFQPGEFCCGRSVLGSAIGSRNHLFSCISEGRVLLVDHVLPAQSESGEMVGRSRGIQPAAIQRRTVQRDHDAVTGSMPRSTAICAYRTAVTDVQVLIFLLLRPFAHRPGTRR
jgi:hypothetical protein